MKHSARPLVTAAFIAGWVTLWPAMAGAVDYLADAQRLMAAGDLPAARLQLRNAIKAQPMNAAAHYRLGQVDLQLGDAPAAEKEAQTAQEQGYDEAAALTLRASAYLNEGRYRDLLRDFPAGQGATDVAAATMTARGQAQLQLDHADLAADSFAEAHRLAPGAVAPLLGEAQVALINKDRATALQKVTAALQIDPASAEALQRQSSLLAEAGDKAGAIAAADKAVAAAPGQYAFRLDRAGLLIAFNQNTEARADVDAVLALAPGNARATYFRAVLLLRAGQYAAANADLDRLSSFISQYPGAYLVQALVKQQMGQTEQALDAATRYVGRSPGEPRGVLLLAELQMQSKRPDKAVETLTPLVDASTDNPAIYDLRGAALTRLGRLQDALRDYQKALALRPDDATLLSHVGAAELALNQTDGAASALGRSVSLAPAQPQTEALLAMAQLDAGRFDDAQKTIDQLRTQQGGTEAVGILAGGVDLAQFNLPAAQQAFEAVLHEHPDSVAARLSLARVALLQGRDADVASLMGEVLQREPAREPVVTDLTAQLLRQGKTADAVSVLERAHAAAPANPRFLARLGGLYISTGEPQKALALATSPDGQPAPNGVAAVPALLVKAEAQLALKQIDAARDTYRQVLAIDHTILFARLQLVRLLMVADDKAGAQMVVQEGLQADPQNEQLLQASVEVDAKGGGLDGALASAAKLNQDPTHQPASFALQGDLYMGAKRFDDAARAYATSLKSTPSLRLALRLARAQLAAGHADQAAQGMRDWLAQHPGDLEAEQVLSDLDITARRLPSAKALLTDLLAKRPNDAKVLNNLAWIDQQSRDPQAALLAQRAYQLAPGPQTADTWGYILATGGGGDHGVSLLRLATLQAPGDPAMQYHLAVAYQAAGQPAEAVKVLTPLIAGPAEFTERPQARQLLTTLAPSKP